jgi:hypothetical protein
LIGQFSKPKHMTSQELILSEVLICVVRPWSVSWSEKKYAYPAKEMRNEICELLARVGQGLS